jgi:thymidine phosphorylase
LVVHRRIGDRIAAGDVLAELHLSKPDAHVVERVRDCFVLGDREVVTPPLVHDRID